MPVKVSAFFVFSKTRARAFSQSAILDGLVIMLVSLTDGFIQFLRDHNAHAGEQGGYEIPVFPGAADGGDIDGDAQELFFALLQYLGAVTAIGACQLLDLSHYLVEVSKDGDSIARDHCKSVFCCHNENMIKSC